MASWRKVISLLANAPKALRPTTASSVRLISTQQQRKFKQDEVNDRSSLLVALAIASATGVALKMKSGDEGLLAESEEFAHENRVRMFMGLDKIFNYFASFQVTNKSGTGAGVHIELTEDDVRQGKCYLDKSPGSKSVLNEIGAQGLLSYDDFCFLITLLSTPPRYIDTAFNLFDVTGDGNIEAKEFAFVSSKMAHKAGGFGTYTEVEQEQILLSNSGLLNYLFGKDRSKSINKETFKKLQDDLLEEVIELEFKEFDKDNSGRISEVDLCKFLLKNTKVPPKKKAAMLKRVEKQWPSKARGISFPSFKNLFYVLAGGAELERALFFLDVEGIGVDIEEFRKISSWVSQKPLSDHVAKVLYVLLDEDGDERFFKEEIGPVLLDWRQSRGFDKGSIKVQMGQLRI